MEKNSLETRKEVIKRFNLSPQSFVMELASNDGYLLRNFVDSSIPCIGVEPTKSTAEASRKLNIEVIEEFFGDAIAQKIVNDYQQADLIIVSQSTTRVIAELSY